MMQICPFIGSKSTNGVRFAERNNQLRQSGRDENISAA
jgi:hypothetical protein